jgi:hypothetical protein
MNFSERINLAPETIQFSETISFIDENYLFNPIRFKNGEVLNESNQNNGSCKIFSFAKMKQLTKEQTLNLFGDYYRKDVLQNPEGEDHANIRNFIQSGWEGIVFEGTALKTR